MTRIPVDKHGMVNPKDVEKANRLAGEAQGYNTTRQKMVDIAVEEAFIAIEDRRFYSHDGADYQGILRAVISNLQARGVVEGASTITQQLARIVFLDQDRKFESPV